MKRVTLTIDTRGEFNNSSVRERSLFWYLSLLEMCKALHQYNERPQALASLNLPQDAGVKLSSPKRTTPQHVYVNALLLSNCACFFFKIIFLEKFFQEYHQSVKQFGPPSGRLIWVKIVCKGYQQTILLEIKGAGTQLLAHLSRMCPGELLVYQ